MGALMKFSVGATSRRSVSRGRLTDRVRARLCAATLDRELANGVPAHASPALVLRAHALAQPSVPRELGNQLRRIVREAHEPTCPGTYVQARRERVIAAEDDLRRLAIRLQSPRSAAIPGLAKVRVLLTDGSGPLYYRDSAEDLGARIRQATSALT